MRQSSRQIEPERLQRLLSGARYSGGREQRGRRRWTIHQYQRGQPFAASGDRTGRRRFGARLPRRWLSENRTRHTPNSGLHHARRQRKDARSGGGGTRRGGSRRISSGGGRAQFRGGG